MTHKFIAYDREKKEWVDTTTYGEWEGAVLVSGNGDVFTVHELAHGCNLNIANHITIYPYINRTDKDGDKIYEGSLFAENDWAGVVEYYPDYCCYILRYTHKEIGFIRLQNLDIKSCKLTGHIAEDKGEHHDNS